MNNSTIIIAEAGVNHNGDFDLAIKLIDAAADSGADYVKFQSFKADKLVTKSAPKAEYQKINLNDSDNSQYLMLKKLEMPEKWHHDLKEYANSRGIKFLSTGFDEESVDFLDRLGVDLFKIPSGEITNKPFLQHIARKGKPVVLSTGMADMDEIIEAVKLLTEEGLSKDMLTVLHCNTEYPTPMEDVNLLAMNSIRQELGVSVGYSDHTKGIEVPIAAVALGACIIEKHFTLDRNLEGPDHRASINPVELISMVEAIRNIELALSGNGLKKPSQSEIKNKFIARKSIHLKNDVLSGHLLKGEDVEMKRPGDGLSPMLLDKVIGRKVIYDLQAEHKLSLKDLE